MMHEPGRRSAWQPAARYLVAAVLCYAASAKGTGSSSGPSLYTRWTDALPILAWVLPTAYLLSAASLIFGKLLKLSCSLLLVMLSVFTTALVVEAASPTPIACGCFGSSADDSIETVVRGLVLAAVRNMFLMLVIGTIFVRESTVTPDCECVSGVV